MALQGTPSLIQAQGIGIGGPVGGGGQVLPGPLGAGPAGVMNPMMMMALQQMMRKRRQRGAGGMPTGAPGGASSMPGPLGAGPAGQLGPVGTPLATLTNSAAGGPFAQSPQFGGVGMQGSGLGNMSAMGAGPAGVLGGGRRRHLGGEPDADDATRGYGMGAGPAQVLYHRLYGGGGGAEGAGPAVVTDPATPPNPTLQGGPIIASGPFRAPLDPGFLQNHPAWLANHPGASSADEEQAAQAWAMEHGNANLGGRPIINRGFNPPDRMQPFQHPLEHPVLQRLLQRPGMLQMVMRMMQNQRGFERPGFGGRGPIQNRGPNPVLTPF